MFLLLFLHEAVVSTFTSSVGPTNIPNRAEGFGSRHFTLLNLESLKKYLCKNTLANRPRGLARGPMPTD